MRDWGLLEVFVHLPMPRWIIIEQEFWKELWKVLYVWENLAVQSKYLLLVILGSRDAPSRCTATDCLVLMLHFLRHKDHTSIQLEWLPVVITTYFFFLKYLLYRPTQPHQQPVHHPSFWQTKSKVIRQHQCLGSDVVPDGFVLWSVADDDMNGYPWPWVHCSPKMFISMYTYTGYTTIHVSPCALAQWIGFSYYVL